MCIQAFGCITHMCTQAYSCTAHIHTLAYGYITHKCPQVNGCTIHMCSQAWLCYHKCTQTYDCTTVAYIQAYGRTSQMCTQVYGYTTLDGLDYLCTHAYLKQCCIVSVWVTTLLSKSHLMTSFLLCFHYITLVLVNSPQVEAKVNSLFTLAFVQLDHWGYASVDSRTGDRAC